jgi:hypothetical protein
MLDLLAFLFIAFFLPAEAIAADSTEVDALLGRVGREAVLVSDLQRFSSVDKVLACAGVLKREKPLPTDRLALLRIYVDEELMYQEARAKKVSTAGQIPISVQMIQGKESCRSQWLSLGGKYSRLWRTETRPREGEGMLVRELEKRVLVEKFRKSEVIPDFEL